MVTFQVVPRLIRIDDWRHEPRKRRRRFRCQECQRLIGDGTRVVIERRGKSSHGYHAACFDAALAGPRPSNAKAALARCHRD